MNKRNLLVIGGDAAAMTAASKVRRTHPELEIIVFERRNHTSYAACGMPYYIGIEMAEALLYRSIEVTLIDMAPQLMTTLDKDMAGLIPEYITKHQVKIFLEEKLVKFEKNADGSVKSVITDKQTIPADIVILGMGIKPNSGLAGHAGIKLDSSASRALITVDENGKPQAREMSPFPPEDNWVIWLGTTQGSRKAKQIQNNPKVIVYYSEPQSSSYVSVAGTARLVNDPEKKSKYWVEGWERFYPDREKNYILIEVTPVRIEAVSIKNNILWNSQGAAQSVDFVVNQKK